MKIYTNVDLNFNEAQNIKLQQQAPSNPVAGTIYYDTINKCVRYFDGEDWISVSGSGGGSTGENNVLEADQQPIQII